MPKPYCIVFFLVLFVACKQAYEPPAIVAPNHYLVVDGVINTLPDSKTTIQLSRTKNLKDSFQAVPESAARVQIEAKSGAVYTLQEQNAGVYTINHLTLSAAENYRLNIRTTNGTQYFSDFVPVKQTPPIDSVTWKQDGGVTFYVNTHDPLNAARYYRWDFTETWQYRSALLGNYGLGVSNGLIFFKDTATQTNDCWSTQNSTEIILASSNRLSEDVIDHFPVNVIEKNAEKLGIRYSTLMRQYALTEDAYKYWEILQKNSQTLGTLFDAQPGQLVSNIHRADNSSEPVIGYASACAVQEKRIFVDHLQLFDWNPTPPNFYCGVDEIAQNSTNFLIWNYPDTTFGPWYFVSPAGLKIAKLDCLDCRRRGGTNQKPSFW